MTIPAGILIFKIHFMIMKYLYNEPLRFADIALEYVVLFLMLSLINHFLLLHNLKFYLIEDFFKKKEYPKYYDILIIGLVVLFTAIMMI